MGGSLSLLIANKKKFSISGVIFFAPGLVMNPVNKLPLGIIHYFQLLCMPKSYLFPPSYKSGCRHKLYVDKIKSNPYIYNGDVRSGTMYQIGKNIPKFRD
jgi:hypothetical protein